MKSYKLLYVVVVTFIFALNGQLGVEGVRKRMLPEGPRNIMFYLHNTVYNPAVNNSAFDSVYDAGPANFSQSNPYNFGVGSTFEDPLTIGPNRTSTKIGVAQGIWVSSSQSGYDLFETFTATFNITYNGTLSISGQIKEVLSERIMAVIGGTGDFLGARGVAICKLVTMDNNPPASWTLSFNLDLYY